MADNDKAAVDMNIKLDLSQFIQTAAALTAEPAQLTPEEQTTLDSLAREGIDMSVRFDMASGKFYVNMAGSVLADAGLDKDTWYLMDMNALYAQAGMDMDWTQLLEASKTMATDYTALAKLMLGRLTPTTASEEGYGVSYGVIKESVENVVYALSDGGFTKEGNTYTRRGTRSCPRRRPVLSCRWFPWQPPLMPEKISCGVRPLSSCRTYA